MKSKWHHLKNKAIGLRRRGKSIRHIESKLGIPRSTLSGWFKNIMLSAEQKDKLQANWKLALKTARAKAVLVHNRGRDARIAMAAKHATKVLDEINLESMAVLDLALAMLYLGEGFKTKGTGIGNSDPLILKFFLSVLRKIYPFCMQHIKCCLHLRMDQ